MPADGSDGSRLATIPPHLATLGAVVALLLPTPLGLVAERAEAPAGCVLGGDGYRCEWDLAPPETSFQSDLPRTGLTIFQVRVTADLPGSYVWLIRPKGQEDDLSTLQDPAARSEASGAGFASPGALEEDWTIVARVPDEPHEFRLEMQAPNALHVVLEAVEAHGTDEAGVRAGSPGDPQIVDATGDTSGPGFTDVAAAWFDDPVLDDGIIDAGIVVPRLSEVALGQEERLDYILAFTILGTRWEVMWGFSNSSALANGWWATLLATNEAGSAEIFLDPTIDLENGTLTVQLPLSGLGDPGSDTTFDDVSVNAYHQPVNTRFLVDDGPDENPSDSAATAVRPFAVGGPAVWARLRGDSITTTVAGPAAAFPWWILALVAFAVLASAGALTLAARRRASPVAAAPAPGVVLLGKYLVERRLGRGAFGEVWLAQHLALKRPVVLKRLHPEWTDVAAARERFREEARILASLDHANVTRTHDAEIVGSAWYLAMEYVEGGSLDARLAKGRLPRAEAHALVRGLLAGLAYVHGRGIVHRDLKPANILLTPDGLPKIADFGVARASASPRLTAGIDTPGTPLYMAPEQIRGETADARSDVYAAAAVAYEVLTGRYYLDVDVADAFAVQRAVVDAPVRPAPELSPALAAWLARGLAKRPADRFAAADEMLAALPS